jgi:hypothetical protein
MSVSVLRTQWLIDTCAYSIQVRVSELEALPLTPEQRDVIQRLQAAVDARRFGPEERALFKSDALSDMADGWPVSEPAPPASDPARDASPGILAQPRGRLIGHDLSRPRLSTGRSSCSYLAICERPLGGDVSSSG